MVRNSTVSARVGEDGEEEVLEQGDDPRQEPWPVQAPRRSRFS